MFWTKRADTDAKAALPHFAGQPLELRRSPRARGLRLSIDVRTRCVQLTLPPRAGLASALVWAESRRDWAEAQLARLPAPQPIVPGMRFGLAGHEVVLDWSPALPRTPKRHGDNLRIGGPRETLDLRVLRYLRAEARRMLTEDTRAIAERAGVAIQSVGVGDPVSRWGSCNAAGAIRYSWRLILCPPIVRQAIVAHEVAHRIHMNHGPAFHALATSLTEGDPAAARRWLRDHGPALHAFGRG